MFDNFSAKLYEERWFSAYIFVAKMHALVKILRVRWSAEAYTHGFKKEKEDPEKDRQFDVRAVTVVLQDPMFHVYNYLILAVGAILRRLSAWIESCPCHTKPLRDESTGFRRNKYWKGIFKNNLHDVCPLGGCRAPELAVGALENTLQRIVAMSAADLVRRMPERFPADDRNVVMADFEIAKGYVEFGLRLKFDCYRRLPWQLAGLGHHDFAVKVSTAQAAVASFDDSIAGGADPSLHHPLTVKLLGHGTNLREQMEAVAAGRPVGLELAFEAARLQFVPVAERAFAQ